MGRPAALILALLAGAQAQSPAAPPDGDPAPRRAIAGIRSLECASTVAYDTMPEAPHRLHAVYAFPDRARWWLGVGAEPSTRRQMRLRSGAALWAVDPDAAASRRLDGRERDLTLVQLEMRRALFLWPHGFEWERTGKRAEAKLADLGTLTVTFADARARNPASLAFTGTDGAGGDEYRAVVWRDEKQKSWPVRLELWHEKARVWTETVVSVETGARYIDSFFVPPDTRDTAGAKPRDVATVRPTDLPEHRSMRVLLPPGADWDTARAEHARLALEHGRALEKQALKLDVNATFEVSEALQPVAVLLRLAPGRVTIDAATAKAWPLTPERPGLSTFVIGLHSLSPARLADLRAQAPSDAVCGTPYVRFDPAHPDQYVMVLVPLSPKAALEDK